MLAFRSLANYITNKFKNKPRSTQILFGMLVNPINVTEADQVFPVVGEYKTKIT